MIGNNKIEVTELPIKKWTEDFDANQERKAKEAEERAGDLLYDPQLVNKIKETFIIEIKESVVLNLLLVVIQDLFITIVVSNIYRQWK